MIRTLPPTGAPISFKDIFNGIKAQCSTNNVVFDFQNIIQEYFDITYSFLLSSGKAALYVVLKALSSLSKRREIIIPAYSSYCLASAAAKARLTVLPIAPLA